MNSIFKKILTIFCLFILLFSASFQPKANANPGLAIPAGIEIGAGAYVLVALALGGTAGILGYEAYSDEIYAHAHKVWDGAQDTVKESLRLSIEAANAAGSYAVTLSSDVVDFFKSVFAPSIDVANGNVNYTYTSSEGVFKVTETNLFEWHRQIIGYNYYGSYLTFTSQYDNYGRIHKLGDNLTLTRSIFSDGTFNYMSLNAPGQWHWKIYKDVDLTSLNSLSALAAYLTGAVHSGALGVTKFEIFLPTSEIANRIVFDNVIDNILQRDRAGNPQILIPTPTFVPKVAQGVPNAGQPLQWDGTKYKLGKDVYTGPIDWDIPKPTIKDKTVVVPLPNTDGIITNTKVNDYTWDGTGVSVINNDIEIDEKRIGHIFRDSDGHFTEDTAENREELLNTANEDNYLGEDQYGNDWYAKNRDDGSQIWVQARNNKIINGGLNPTPRPYNDMSGLSKPTKPPQKILNIAGEEVMSLSELEAFNAMVDFLEEYYKRTKADEIGDLLGSLIILNDGSTADPSAWKDWIQSVSRIKENN